MKDCIEKAETCGHRNWEGKCGVFGCIIKYNKPLTPMEKFVFGLNPYEKKQLEIMLGRDEDV